MIFSNCINIASLGASPKKSNDRFKESHKDGAMEGMHTHESSKMPKKVHLLDLPKELRLEIWSYVVGSTQEDAGRLHIQRDLSGEHSSAKRYLNSLHKCSCPADIIFSLESRFLSPGFTSILSVNRLIYHEALPILYSPLTIHPCDIQGTFSIFLNMLSEYALSCIRRISLDVHQALGSPGSFFYWAVTCAQVAKLGKSLRLVEITNVHALLSKDLFTKHAVLFPLLKIKTLKRFVQGTIYGSPVQGIETLIEDMTNDFDMKCTLRRAAAAADANEGAKQKMLESPHVSKKQISSFAIRNKFSSHSEIGRVDEDQIARDLSMLSGIERFERELLEWDMVSRSASPAPSYPFDRKLQDDAWTETASTLAATDLDDSDDGWEIVKKSPLQHKTCPEL